MPSTHAPGLNPRHLTNDAGTEKETCWRRTSYLEKKGFNGLGLTVQSVFFSIVPPFPREGVVPQYSFGWPQLAPSMKKTVGYASLLDLLQEL